MSWTSVLANWSQLVDHLCKDFPHLDHAAIQRFRGDRGRLETYLAETHDLTPSEAAETLDDWILFNTVPPRDQSDAA